MNCRLSKVHTLHKYYVDYVMNRMFYIVCIQWQSRAWCSRSSAYLKHHVRSVISSWKNESFCETAWKTTLGQHLSTFLISGCYLLPDFLFLKQFWKAVYILWCECLLFCVDLFIDHRKRVPFLTHSGIFSPIWPQKWTEVYSIYNVYGSVNR